jgi:hypothetical protein
MAKDKMMENVGSKRPKTPAPSAENQEEIKSINIAADSAITVRRSLITQELSISQMNMDHFPVDLGSTLALQVKHLHEFATKL